MRRTVTTALHFDIDADPESAAETTASVRVNGHPLWDAMYPAGTTHEKVMEDVLDRLRAALTEADPAPGKIRSCLWCHRKLPFVADDHTGPVECQCGLRYDAEMIRDIDERTWTQILARDGYSVERSDGGVGEVLDIRRTVAT